MHTHIGKQAEVLANCNNLLCEGWHHPTGGQTNDPSVGGGGAGGVHIISSGPHSCKKIGNYSHGFKGNSAFKFTLQNFSNFVFSKTPDLRKFSTEPHRAVFILFVSQLRLDNREFKGFKWI